MDHRIELLISGNTVRIKNKGAGIKAIIHKSKEGYAVGFRGKTGEYFGDTEIFKLPGEAILYAKKGVAR